jgi:hypothetical protein
VRSVKNDGGGACTRVREGRVAVRGQQRVGHHGGVQRGALWCAIDIIKHSSKVGRKRSSLAFTQLRHEDGREPAASNHTEPIMLPGI